MIWRRVCVASARRCFRRSRTAGCGRAPHADRAAKRASANRAWGTVRERTWDRSGLRGCRGAVPAGCGTGRSPRAGNLVPCTQTGGESRKRRRRSAAVSPSRETRGANTASAPRTATVAAVCRRTTRKRFDGSVSLTSRETPAGRAASAECRKRIGRAAGPCGSGPVAPPRSGPGQFLVAGGAWPNARARPRRAGRPQGSRSLVPPRNGPGSSWSQAAPGRMHERGRGVPEDHEEAVRWYRRAARRVRPEQPRRLVRARPGRSAGPRGSRPLVHLAALQGNERAKKNPDRSR